MLSLTSISLMLMLLLTPKTTSKPKSLYMQTYWKTTYVTDKVPDYWNHGSIYISGLHKKPDIFPAWLTKISFSETTDDTQANPVTDDDLTNINTTLHVQCNECSSVNINYTETPLWYSEETDTRPEITTKVQSTAVLDTTILDDEEQIITDEIEQSTTESPVILTTIPSSTKPHWEEIEPIIRAIEREPSTDAFSVFLRKILIILTTKKAAELPTLVYQFKQYLSMLLTNGQLEKLGISINNFIASRILILDQVSMEELHDYFDELQKNLAHRSKKLTKDVNDILDFMDDTYDEAEEEAMQAVLREASLYPNSRNNDKIAQGLIDYVFIKPIQRVAGTSRGNVLFEMITNAIVKRYKVKQKSTTAPSIFSKEKKYKHKRRRHKHLRKNFEDMQKLRHETSETSNKVNENIPRMSYKDEIKEGEDASTSECSSEGLSESSETSNYFGESSDEIKIRNDFQLYFNEDENAYKHSSVTHNENNVLEATESSDIETVLKAKIYESFRRMDNVNNNETK